MNSFYVTLVLTLMLAPLTYAETHGGVLRSNSAFTAVANYAVQEGGSLSRVMGISKLYRVPCHYDIYAITWGGMDADGVEHAYPKPDYVVVKDDGETADGELRLKVETLIKLSCPKN